MQTVYAVIENIDASSWLTILAIFVLLGISAFFSGSETALTAASRGKLHSMADKGSRGAKRALALTEDTERLIGAVLLGNNLVNILAAALATSLFTRLFGDSGVALATLVMTLLVLIFAEVLPKTYAISNSEGAASFVSAPIRALVIIFAPIVATVRITVRAILRLFGAKMTGLDEDDAAQKEIAGAIALSHSEGNFEKDDRDRLLGALDLKDREVEEIMLHRSDIEIIDAAASPQDIVTQSLASRYTRLPIFKDEPENIIGVIHTKDLLREVDKLVRGEDGGPDAIDRLNIIDIAREPYFVPETTPLDDQMREFLLRKAHFALVVDEYGDLQGLITLEDILEEIVGEITDEHDEDAEILDGKDTSGNFKIDGSATIRDVNRMHEWNLPDDEANTIAGLVIHEAQMIPKIGQVFSFHGFRFEIAGRDQNRITKLKVRTL
ncbi:HlyC/CorC family transporter [Amylibacter sp.]|jgi:Mg2+/Co2+ transporter CorB|nr:CBS domain protein [alpha proteobacterium HTCC2255] [Rhodobacterales bacterium HTCC2255]MBT3952629.1 HlyC/CorC family transporter [Rhodobacterales bacterium]MDA7846699.1 HlyC/CorC family transporter [Amylibacter sp.]MBT4133624.1 HlyC/CorC family transporter [Rhodobacterales bacterium]MBT4323325.1 HlyC/CorC family transporter [Rhodobacterales bacterium]|tara:strand:+ start:321 stop:1637 length:1317 start_codon:yes stop_codon:yes gene_type:complete